jgi:hypothetical protein
MGRINIFGIAAGTQLHRQYCSSFPHNHTIRNPSTQPLRFRPFTHPSPPPKVPTIVCHLPPPFCTLLPVPHLPQALSPPVTLERESSAQLSGRSARQHRLERGVRPTLSHPLVGNVSSMPSFLEFRIRSCAVVCARVCRDTLRAATANHHCPVLPSVCVLAAGRESLLS